MKSLRECATLSEAEPFLRNATPTFRKTVETAFALMSHPNPTQQALGQGFWQTAIQESENSAEPVPKHGDYVKPKGDHFVQEEELSGGNKSGTEGSEQSTDNTPPYPQEGEQSENGQKDMEKAEGTENQFSESMPGMMPGMMPGLDPKLAQAMAPAQGLPPMTTPQQIQQMQYTVKEMTKGMVQEIARLNKIVGFQNKAIKDLSGQFKETMTLRNGIDVNGIAERSLVPSVQETTIPSTVSNIDLQNVQPRIYENKYNLQAKRSKIAEMNRMLENQ